MSVSAGRVSFPVKLDSRMSPEDALHWYSLESSPGLRPFLGALLLLDRAPEAGRFRAMMDRLLSWVPRFQQRVVEAPLQLALPEWEDDPQFEMDYHVREVVLPAPGTSRHLLDFVGAVFASPLDHLRPLWEAYLIEGLDEGGAALFFKVHQTLLDGVGWPALLEAITQAHAAEPVRIARRDGAGAPRRDLHRLGDVARDGVANAAASVRAAADLMIGLVSRPTAVWHDSQGILRGAATFLRDLAGSHAPDPLSEQCAGVGRRLHSMSFPMARLRRITRPLDCDARAAVITALAGGLARYCTERGAEVDELRCAVAVPLASGPREHAPPGAAAQVEMVLPLSIREPLLLLELVRKQMAAGAADVAETLAPATLRTLAVAPGFAFRLLAGSRLGRVHLVCSSVTAPSTERYLAGARVQSILPFGLTVLSAPLSVAMSTYADTLCLGISTDPAAVPQPENLVERIDESMRDLEQRVAPGAAHHRSSATPGAD